MTDKVDSFADLYDGTYTWSNAFQMLSYLFSKEQRYGLFVMDRSGLPKLMKVDLMDHMAGMEEFLKEAELCVDHVESGTLPDYIQDAAECKRCPFFAHSCNPPMDFGPGASVFTDPEVIQKAERYIDLERKLSDEEWTEYNRLDKWAKEQFRGVETGIVGGLMISGKWQNMTKVVVPEEQEAEFNKKKIEYDDYAKTFSVKDPKGKFVLTLTRVLDLKPPEPAKPAAAEKPKARKKKADTEPASA